MHYIMNVLNSEHHHHYYHHHQNINGNTHRNRANEYKTMDHSWRKYMTNVQK